MIEYSMYIKIYHFGNPNRYCLDCEYRNICSDFDVSVDDNTVNENAYDCGMYTLSIYPCVKE